MQTVYSTVHYLWCGKKTFQFHDYLGVLSALRVLQPTKVVFHYTYLPKTDDYNSWFLVRLPFATAMNIVHSSLLFVEPLINPVRVVRGGRRVGVCVCGWGEGRKGGSQVPPPCSHSTEL